MLKNWNNISKYGHLWLFIDNSMVNFCIEIAIRQYLIMYDIIGLGNEPNGYLIFT